MKIAAVISKKQNESRAAAHSIFQLKRNQNGFADNRSRPAASRLTPGNNSIQMVKEKEKKKEEKTQTEKSRYKFREKTKEERFKRKRGVRSALAHEKNTRFAEQVRKDLEEGKFEISKRDIKSSPFKKASDNTELWDGFSRPTWAGGFEDEFWGKQINRIQNARREYWCRIDKGDNFDWLPRKSDAQSGEDFATIGHKVQWRDYIVANVSYKSFIVPGGLILAISKEDALNAYQSEKNLEPQGMSFNSQIASSYSSDPLFQEWSNV